MTHEEGFVGGDVLHTYDVVAAFFDYLIHKQEGVAVGKQGTDLVVVHQRLKVGIVSGPVHPDA